MLDLVDQTGTNVECLAAMRGTHGSYQCHIAYGNPPDAMADRQRLDLGLAGIFDRLVPEGRSLHWDVPRTPARPQAVPSSTSRTTPQNTTCAPAPERATARSWAATSSGSVERVTRRTAVVTLHLRDGDPHRLFARPHGRAMGPSTFIPSRTPPGEPGRVTISARPIVPATPRDKTDVGTTSRDTRRSASAMPGTSRSSSGRTASGVTSVGVSPVPPVVSTTSAPDAIGSCRLPAGWHRSRQGRSPDARRPRPRPLTRRATGRRSHPAFRPPLTDSSR